jgi:hypothetical protein
LTGGYNYHIPDTKIILKPSTLIKTFDFVTYQVDIGARAELDNKFWGGLAYRIDDAVIFLFGLNLSSGITAGFSYDLITSKIRTVSAGSVEVFLAYNFDFVLKSRTSKYKSVRIL